ncbi:hypothetical protein ACJJTC_013713 [Scirpophaga incertulas]
MNLQIICLFVFLMNISVRAKNAKQPNIVFIVADDLGWDDVSFHGSDQILTPNIDMLAYQGVILNQYYTGTGGSEARSALFTGKYPMRLGMQGDSIRAAEDRGVPLTDHLLPHFLRELGYKTHLVGKWGVGKSRAHFLPTRRGFDTFYGFLGNAVDYLTYNTVEECNGTTFFGLDFFNNIEPIYNQTGHLTEVLTEKAVEVIRKHNTSKPLYLHISHAAPHVGGGLVSLQPPLESLKANSHIAHSARRLYAGLVTSLDVSIGNIVASLAERNILQNTIIVFVSDNGAPSRGPTQNFGSNLPFRGIKGTPWEGCVRSTAIVWHNKIVSKSLDSIFHVTDWCPTLIAAAGGSVSKNIDGYNQWNTITDEEPSQRHDALIAINDLEGWAAFREGDYKIIVGNVQRNVSGYYGNEFKQQLMSKKIQPLYDDILIASETAHVFKEILNIAVDVDTVFFKRKNMNVTHFIKSNMSIPACFPTKVKGCLYNISVDPLETNDLWFKSSDVARRMALRLRSLWSELQPRRQPLSDSRANPSLRNYVWSPWVKNDELTSETPTAPKFPSEVTKGELQYLVDLNFNSLKDRVNMFIGNMRDTMVKSVGGLFSV